MAFYENTVVARQDLAEKELKDIKEKYNSLINNYNLNKLVNLMKEMKISEYLTMFSWD